MLRMQIDYSQPQDFVEYLRMSLDQQNPRSPDQQSAEIERRVEALRYPWTVVQRYRDEGISGRYTRRRTAFQRMLRDLKSGTVRARLILVDTLERFGRMDEVSALRQSLMQEYGIYVLTADSGFADPTTTSGRALAFVEHIRSTEDGRVKAHNVLRGKRDAAELKQWPGGPPPFGYRLKKVMKVVNGEEEVDHKILVPDPASRHVIEILFELAATTLHGPTRLAASLNADKRIPEKFKPFAASKVAYWLANAIYRGDLVWGVHETGVVNDSRVIRPSAEGEALLIEEFCEAIVSKELWEMVAQLRAARKDRAAARNENDPADASVRAPGLGLVLKYPMSGLIYCECGRRMTASSGGIYSAKSGEERRYVSYVCAGYLEKTCSNGTRIPEDWIRSAVINQILERLLSPDDTSEAQ